MRQRLTSFLLACAALLAASCDPHQFPSGDGDFAVQLRFHYNLPLHRTLEGRTKAKAESRPQARYHVQLFRYVGEYDYTVAPEYSFSFVRGELEDLDTTLVLPVAPERYKVLAWTDYVDAAGKPYWEAEDFNEISLPDGYAGGRYARDAFRGGGMLDLSALKAAGLSRVLTVEMTRPVAQVRVLIPDALTWLSSKAVSASSLQAFLSWGAALPDGFDLFGDRSTASRQGAAFSAVPELDDEGNLILCVDHVLTGADGLTLPASFRLTGADGAELAVWDGNVPLLRAHRTDIILRAPLPPGPDDPSTDTGGGIGIDPQFQTEIEITI